MKNKLVDLNNHLFEQLERLNDSELKGEDLREEIAKADTVCKVSEQIIDNQSLILKMYTSLENNVSCKNSAALQMLVGKADE